MTSPSLNLSALLLFGILTAAVHWTIARSSVFSWFWRRAKGPFDSLLRCAACSGFWIGLGLGSLGLDPLSTSWDPWLKIVTSGGLGLWLTPIFEGALLWGLRETSLEP